MTARDEILARIRTSLGDARTPVPVPRDYARTTTHADPVDLFAERAADYQATVRRVAPADLPAAIAEALGDARSVALPADIPDSWLSLVTATRRGDTGAAPLGTADLDAVDAVLTGCATAIAETGTVVLDAGPRQGRRALTLVPDHHICVVDAASVVGTVPEAVTALDGTRPLTWISGPSATSDIELHRVEGVHGPRTLTILVVDTE